MEFILQPQNNQSVGQLILKALNNELGDLKSMTAAVAFAKSSGIAHIEDSLRSFADKGNSIKIIVGIDHEGTSIEALEMLLNLSSENVEIWINHVEQNFVTFHPKVYIFEGEAICYAIIGSNNLTQGGLFTNDEISVVIKFDLTNRNELEELGKLKHGLDYWSDSTSGNARLLTAHLLDELKENQYIFSEQVLKVAQDVKNSSLDNESSKNDLGAAKVKIFQKSSIDRKAPSRIRKPVTAIAISSSIRVPVHQPNQRLGFVMTLQKTDVGSGQVTAGTNRRSPEIFIPLSARDVYPEFWGWITAFTQDASKPNKYDRLNVKMRLGGNIVNVNMMTWPDKHDFRLRSEALRSSGNIGDVLRIEASPDDPTYDYYVEIIPVGTADYNTYFSLCDQITRNSLKKWGYYGL